MAKKKSDSPENEASSGSEPSKPYVVLARKYRPATFDDLIGQSAMVTTLRNAFASGRIAQGYMLTGVRGVGKTTTARILARALNYEAPGYDKPTIDMPGLGVHCKDIMEGRHPDVLEMDAASNTGVDNIREIIESSQYTPLVARTKVFLIDEVHMLSKGAFNALLKTLEEPPSHVRFIFATTEIRKVPVTVLSRCQRFDLRRVEQPVLAAHFQKIVGLEGAQADADALQLIARAAEGSVRDGLSILDQAIAMGEGHVTATKVRDMLGLADRARIFDLAESLFKGDVAAAIRGLESLHRDGAEAAEIVADLAEAVHAIARVKAVGEEPAGEALTAEEKARIASLASRLSMPYLARAWQMLVKGYEEVARAPNPRVAAEMVLIRLAYTSDLPTPDELIKTLGGGAVAQRRPALPAGDAPASERTPLNAATRQPIAQNDADEFGDAFEFDDGLPAGEEESEDELAIEGGSSVSAAAMKSDPRSFADVIALVGEKRDAKLKIHLEDHVSLVKFDAVAGSIDIFLLPDAPAELANDLREKLNSWTTRKWVVVLSKEAGAPPVGVVRREREAQELQSLKEHPAVRAVLEAFPDAKIAEVRRIAGRETDTDSESEAV
ncbi:DNA polymerase III subunit gamma/tau [Hyphomicrobium sp.]|uniref:DNA polymerase III subunit gamma/tau n=1 Tax=Hyphomicrobium sp. TaxID=82 RepID=UPI000FA5AB5F|nr:DNA polymerase III subunit gamma/tau [Hyphomicrobium sp.]RUO99739.1 MAG: DNA polymerase III subunit gamma/tau [Hyphomicrobium sp.]